jgi:hypothetical protein
MDEITLPEGFCDMGVIILPEAFMIGGGIPCLFFNYTLAFALQLRKSTGNLSQGSRLVLH